MPSVPPGSSSVFCDRCYRSSPSLAPISRADVHLGVREQLHALGWRTHLGRRLCPICCARASTLPPPVDPPPSR